MINAAPQRRLAGRSCDSLEEALQRTAPIVSIHDVMPETLSKVEGIIRLLRNQQRIYPTLLIVPGRNWRTAQLAQLRAWADAGLALAGHGWTHESPSPDSFYHRIHSALLSRNVAEHLALDAGGVASLLQRNYDWFGEQYLPAPELYVPPAWAMGAIPRAQLADLPYRYYETLTGIYAVQEKKFHRLPLTGFEADTPLRAFALKLFNTANQALARSTKRPLRVAIHPLDFDYRLRSNLVHILDNATRGD